MTGASSGILVVDDESDSLSLLKSILAVEGYDVRSADSGRLALGSLTNWLPELILLDIRMPDMDGFEVLCRLKAFERSRNVPVIFISGANELEERVKGLTLGAVDYICKPFQREELLARVRTHVELGRLRKQLKREVLERTAELNKTVERLLESEERFRNMADTAPVMIWISGRDKLHTFLNKTWLTFTGRSLEEERGNGWTRGIHPDDLERYFEIYTSSFDACREFEMEYRLHRADGEFRWVLDKCTPRFAPNGEFVGYIGSAIDITDFKRMHEEALSKEKLQSLMSLTRGIAHDFNNMMAAVLAQAELAENDLPEDSAPREQVRHIKAVAIQASEVVRELMIYSGQEEAKLAPIDLSGVVEEISHLLKVSISKHAELHLDLSKDIPPVWGNAVQIRQLAMNLILNASEALGENPGVIHVETSLPAGRGDPAAANIAGRPDDYVRLVVSDTGCGMTEQERARVFDPFFTTKPKGHGLGLAVVQGIVQSHNGVINVKSKLANGTTFEVLFRRAVVSLGAASPETCSSAANKSEACSGAVLLVEDEDSLRTAIETALYKAGFMVLSVADGLKAVEVFEARADDIGVVVLDCALPGLTGQAVFRHIRSIKPEMRVVFTSSSDPRIKDADLSGKPNTAFLQKPYRFSDLLSELSQAHRAPALSNTGTVSQSRTNG